MLWPDSGGPIVPLLEVEGLTIAAGGKPVIGNLGFKIGRGTRLGLVGESGAGKTLVAFAIAGLLPEAVKGAGK